jgi:hypothetical protein
VSGGALRGAARAALGCLALALGGCGGCGGCKGKKKPDDAVSVAPPAPGGASTDLVGTEIGAGLGLPAQLAPTSTKWLRVVALDDKSAVLVGRALDDLIVLRTNDAGRSWTAVRGRADAWNASAIAADGAVALASGGWEKPAKAGAVTPVTRARVWIGGAEGEIQGPIAFLPDEQRFAGLALARELGAFALLDGGVASLYAERRREPVVAWVATAGAGPPPGKLGRGAFVRAPYGRPPQLLSVAGGALEVRPWPAPGAALGPAARVPSLRVSAPSAEELGRGPGCEAGAWSFARLGPSTRATLVGISDSRALSFPLPAGVSDAFGCGPAGVVFEMLDTDGKTPLLVRCSLEGRCLKPGSPPFRIWPEPHERTIVAVPTPAGVVGVLTARAGVRWGVYLAQSHDGGASFELPRVIGEGDGQRGFYELGALVGLGARVVMLLSADVTGTSRRNWYVLASNDGGKSWAPP